LKPALSLRKIFNVPSATSNLIYSSFLSAEVNLLKNVLPIALQGQFSTVGISVYAFYHLNMAEVFFQPVQALQNGVAKYRKVPCRFSKTKSSVVRHVKGRASCEKSKQLVACHSYLALLCCDGLLSRFLCANLKKWTRTKPALHCFIP